MNTAPPNQNSWKPPVLTTSRLVLRPVVIEDASSIFEYAKNPLVSQYTLWEPHQTVEDSVTFIRDYIMNHYAQGVPEPFGIAMKTEPQRLIGTIGCFWVPNQTSSMEMGYAIGEDYWGKGYTAEAAVAVMDFCFREFKLKRLQARCKVENKASARVMEKIGMSYEGCLKSSVFHRNRYWDMLYYSKIN